MKLKKFSQVALGTLTLLFLSACGGSTWQTTEDQQMSYATSSNAVYKDFNKSEYESVKGQKPFVLFFHAQWCSTCRELEKNIKADLQQFPAGTVIFKADYDTEEDLKKEYKVTTQSVFVVVDGKGQVSETLVAPSKAALVKAIQKVNAAVETAPIMEESNTAEEEANESEETKAKEKAAMEASGKTEASAESENDNKAPAQYLNYSASALAASHGKEAYALFFHAPWCHICVGMEADIKASLSTFPAGSKIFKADFDTETKLREQYGVTTQSTIVIVGKDGKVVKKLTGPKAASISSSLAAAL